MFIKLATSKQILLFFRSKELQGGKSNNNKKERLSQRLEARELKLVVIVQLKFKSFFYFLLLVFNIVKLMNFIEKE